MAEAIGLSEDPRPFDACRLEHGQLAHKDLSREFGIGKSVFNHVIKASEQGMVQEIGMVCSCNNQALRCVSFEQLQERVQHPANFSDVIWLIAMCPQRVELVEEINAAGLPDGFEDRSELCRGFTHEFRDQAFEHDREQRRVQLSCKRGRCHGFSSSRWSDEEQFSARVQAMLSKFLLLSLFEQNTI